MKPILKSKKKTGKSSLFKVVGVVRLELTRE